MSNEDNEGGNDEDIEEPDDISISRISVNSGFGSLSRMQVSAWDDDIEGIEEEPDPESNPTILWAAENGYYSIVQKLVAADGNLIHMRDKDGYTPLHRAAYSNHPKVLKYLLSVGADHAAETDDKWQPLHSACKWNNAKCAAILIDHGADINAKSNGGLTPLHLAASNSYAKETIQLLLTNENIQPNLRSQSGETAFEIAQRSGKYYSLFEIVEPCINQITPPNS